MRFILRRMAEKLAHRTVRREEGGGGDDDALSLFGKWNK